MKAAMCSVSGKPRGDIGARGAATGTPATTCRALEIPPVPTRRKLDPVFAEQRLEDLLQALVDRPHHRHAVEDVLAEFDQLAPDQVGGEKAEQRQCRERNDEASAGILIGR